MQLLRVLQDWSIVASSNRAIELALGVSLGVFHVSVATTAVGKVV